MRLIGDARGNDGELAHVLFALDDVQQQEDDDDHQNQPDAAARSITPVSAVWPARNYAK